MGRAKELRAASYWQLCEDYETFQITENEFVDGMRDLGYSHDEIDDHVWALREGKDD